jgi:hypothetical protein
MRYGDTDKVRQDVKTLNDILRRQGSNLLIDVLAEYIGETSLQYKFNSIDIDRLKQSILNELKEAINERT